MTDTIIRADIDKLELSAHLFDEYRQFYQQSSDLAGARDFLRERFSRQESVMFLALDTSGDSEIGLGFVQLYPVFSSVAMRRLWILNDLYVRPKGRRRGLATRLMQRARQYALDTGARGLTLETAANNNAARTLYESLGWRENSEFVHYDLSV